MGDRRSSVFPAGDVGDPTYEDVAELAMLHKRKRASLACISCRERKVRCDAMVKHPDSCTNCALDQAQCTVAPRGRRKRHKMALPATRTPSNLRGLHASNFQSTYGDLFGDYSSVTQSDAPSNIPIPLEREVFSAKSSSALGLKHPSDLANRSPASTNRNLLFSATLSNVSYNSQAMWHPTLSNLGTSQSTTTPDETFLTSSSMNVEDFADGHSLCDFNNYGELSDDPLSSLLGNNPEKNNLPTDLRISPSDLLPDDLETFPLHPYKTSPLYPWVQAWPVRELDDKTWSDITSTKALSRPEWTTVEHLLRLYFQYLNPLLPVLNEREIYYLIHPDAQSDGTPPKPISLALFNAIMFAASSFVLKEDALAASFSSIRSMSSAFFTRAKLLYDLDCEDTAIGRAQICLLLSYRKTYGNYSFESEHFLIGAGRQLEQANVPAILSEQKPPTAELTMWTRLYVSWALRMIYVTLGTRRVPTLKRLMSINVPSMQISALEDDISFSWFLNVKTKRRLAHIFIASVALVRQVVPFCSFLMRESPDATLGSHFHTSLAGRKSILALTEEVENMLADWSMEYALVFEPVASLSDTNDDNRSAFSVQQSFLKLTYNYCISTLHQISLSHDTVSSRWGARMKQLSREALWESVCSTTRTLAELLSKGLIRYLPISALQCILIPFTANNLFVKTALQCNIMSIEGLSICAQSFRILSERYDAADFYMDILNESLVITHSMMLDGKADKELLQRGTRVGTSANPDSKAFEVPLPQADIYSHILRFQEVAFATGSVRNVCNSVSV